MLSSLETSLLKEFDRQRMKPDVISMIMNKLDTDDKKSKFLSFMMENRGIIIPIKEIYSELNQIAK